MIYDVKIKKYKVPNTHEKKCIIFLILNLSGLTTDYGPLVSRGSPQRRGQAEGAVPQERLQLFVLLIYFEKS